MKPVLSIDCGSSNVKAAVFTGDLERIAEHSLPTPYIRNDTTGCELSPGEVREALDTLVRETLAKASLELHALDGIAITSQAQTFAVADAAGNFLTPFISWIDSRAVDEAGTLKERLPGFHQHTSFPHPLPQHQIAKLMQLQRQSGLLNQPGSALIDLASFAALPFTQTPFIDNNLAAMHGCYSVQTNTWWPEALEAANIPAAILPQLVSIGDRVTGAHRRGPAVIFAGNDQTAGAIGSGCSEDDVLITLGTALVAYRVHGVQPGPFSPSGIWGPYTGGRYYELAVRNEGCLALDRARHWLDTDMSVERFSEAARAGRRNLAPDSPMFRPEAASRESAWHTTGERPALAFAILEGITFSLKELLCDDLDLPPEAPVLVQGGGSTNDDWMQLIADVLQRPVQRAEGDSLLGAARVAMPDVQVPVSQTSGKRFHPDTTISQCYAERFETWRTWSKHL